MAINNKANKIERKGEERKVEFYTYADSSRLYYNNPEAMEFRLFHETGITCYISLLISFI